MITFLVLGLALPALGRANDATDDPRYACDRAAKRAEAEWHLPAGLLAAIGVVESGRSGLGGTLPIAWPWSVNAGGRGLYFPNKAAAIADVRAFQAKGIQVIDVGCFQVDVFFHPTAFATLDAAFDPEANAQAAARILTESRLSGNSWETAVALYHSASSVQGGQYLRQVKAVWPRASARSELAQRAGYIALLSPAAKQVRIIVPSGSIPQPVAGMPRVLEPQSSAAVVQWTAASGKDLPVVLTPTRGVGHR
jgi:hypothetical protein